MVMNKLHFGARWLEIFAGPMFEKQGAFMTEWATVLKRSAAQVVPLRAIRE